MQLKDSVALERRVDLASLFCMIGRHGPAVALAVIAMVSVLVGFIIYRSVRGKKRRKATAAAGDGDGDREGQSPGAQGDASGASCPEQDLIPGDPLSSSTDVSRKVWSRTEDDAHLVQPELNLRHRRSAAAENKPSSCSPDEDDTSAPEAEEAAHSWTCETTTGAGVRVETETEDRGGEGVLEEVHHDEPREEDEKVFEAEDLDDETETRDEDVSVLDTSPEEEHFQSVLNDQVCFVQTPRVMSDEDDGTPETNGVEDCMDVPSIHIEDVSMCNGKAEEFEEENDHQDLTDDSNYSSHHFALKEDEDNVDEEAEEDFGLIPQQEEICPSTCEQEPELPSSQEDHETNETNESDWRPGEDDQEDLVPEADDQQLKEQIQAQNDDGENVLHTVTDEEETTSDEAVLCGEGHGCPGVTLVSSLHRVTEPDHKDLSGVDTDAQDQTSGVVDSSESRSDRQQPQSEESKEEELQDSEVLSCEEQVLETISDGVFMTVEEMLVEQDQAGDHVETSEVCEDMSHPDTLALAEDPERHQNELRDRDEGSVSSPGVDTESGISSMAVSPDSLDVGNEFGETSENVVVLELDSDRNAKCESFADNEDVFGHQIEDSYHRALEQVMRHISAASLNAPEELSGQSDVKVQVGEVEVKEKKKDVRAAKKMETEAEKEDDYEKTEISIMEATMDNNEWITDTNYQVLPWMNVTVPSFSQDPGNTAPPPADDHSSSLADDSCADAEPVSQTSVLAAGDENAENNKKVVAVQPMPQNVNVTFRIHYLTSSPYQTVAVTGDQQELGNWKEFIPLERAKDGLWATVVSLPAESHVEWKFVLVEKGEVCRWEECGNRLLDTGYGDELMVHKWWGLL